ncbi:MAG: exo-alpha-sialidase [Bacillati bacterium ANGP1]|uniref:Exo-alpha-sialidase n=1 Tax=Candidatus Segetimicrobium genomatis TaxID=2569760 RepID=A0A537L557_9BACT|nr:MAG: exo-alpha-sialidase [Terrabacteria group bacterium ANGP1]TMJ09360.1 MAG: exo-alpha-sialidase [Terrabacteria group bacterium ANGP1]
MSVRLCVLVLAIALASPLLGTVPVVSSSGSDTQVTQDNTAGSYLRYDGQTDATVTACSTGRRSQNEPTVAVNPRHPNIIIAGSNDYCAQIVNGDVWAGYYRSTNGGHTWSDSLLPGYPKDTSAAGVASPAHGQCGAAGDPTQAFDTQGRLFYGFICFNRVQPINGSMYVATYDEDGARYVRTVLVARGTPSANFAGVFQDKVNLTVDQTGGARTGYVYVAWAKYSGYAPNNVILFSRSTDHGQTFSTPIRVTTGLFEEQFADLAVGTDGDVYLTFRTISHQPSTFDAVWLVKSTDGGVSWSEPQVVATITPFDSDQFGGGDCGDGPFACATGLTYSRFASLSAVAADETGVHVVWSAENTAGQAKIYARNSPDGLTWPTAATTLDSVASGHQYFPDIASANGVITVVFYDSRADTAYAANLPPGDTADGKNSGGAVDTYVAQSTDGGATWSETKVSTFSSNYNWETHGSRRDPFWGDYIYISAVPGGSYVVFTDSRDLVSGSDPREFGVNDDEDGFDVYQPCTYVPNDINAPGYSSPSISNSCLSQGGLDQNIYGAQP